MQMKRAHRGRASIGPLVCTVTPSVCALSRVASPSRKKIRQWNTGESRQHGEDKNFRSMSEEKERRINLVKDKAGKQPLPRQKDHEQETDCGTNRHPQRHSVSIVPAIRGADHK